MALNDPLRLPPVSLPPVPFNLSQLGGPAAVNLQFDPRARAC